MCLSLYLVALITEASRTTALLLLYDMINERRPVRDTDGVLLVAEVKLEKDELLE